MNEVLYDKILGSLLAAGIGDAFGAPSESMGKQEIEQAYGGRLTDFVYCGDTMFAKGNEIGEVTDDASQMYEFAKAVVECGGEMTVEAAVKALISWTELYPKYYPRNAGPTTSMVIDGLKNGEDPIALGKAGGSYNRGTTNGAAMRVAACGLTKVGDLDKAIQNAVTSCRPTHGTQHGMSGAAAVAAGIAEALRPEATTISVVKAMIYGAEKGEEEGLRTGRKAEGARVIQKIRQAIPEALMSHSMEEAEDRIDEIVGCDGSMASSIGAAVGFFLAADGDPMKAIISAANAGGDSDTIACIVGSIAGAFKGAKALDQDLVKKWQKVNIKLALENAAAQLTEIAEKNEED
ncbi:MAG: ADP-ribosylglycohydrolase family protein [Lachnospiraceae bacterium]|nr:ADP-ribosylglycohydrolase family protein [Lachnospiraceae bacterium]